jgi:Flp pilus assembly protein TadB
MKSPRNLASRSRGLRPLRMLMDEAFLRETFMRPLNAARSKARQILVDRSDNQPRAGLKELHGRLFIISWAAAVFVATAGWLYFVGRLAFFLIRWLFQ